MKTNTSNILVNSMDWFKGKSTGNHRFSHEIWGFPVNFPLNQSIETRSSGHFPICKVNRVNPPAEQRPNPEASMFGKRRHRPCAQGNLAAARKGRPGGQHKFSGQPGDLMVT